MVAGEGIRGGVIRGFGDKGGEALVGFLWGRSGTEVEVTGI